MIVRTSPDSLLLITQPDHAALSRRLMEHWQPLHEHPRRSSILHAIGEHDNGWREPDSTPLLDDAGHVVDFVRAPVRVRQGVWPRGVKALADDPFAAALVAQHAITVYERFSRDPEWTGFFAEMATLRDGMRERANLTHDALIADYAFVRLGDLLSLTFCTGWTEVQRYQEWAVRLDDRCGVVVSPGELDRYAVEFEVPARKLPPGPFASWEGFRELWARAEALTLTGVLCPSTV